MKRILLALFLLPALLVGAETDSEPIANLRKKAEQGLAGAQSNLGEMYAHGYGVTKDLAEAARWYRKSAEQGFGEAELNLGMACLQGQGVPKDETEGLAWIMVACRKGSVTLVKFREKVEARVGPSVTAAAQQRSKELVALIEANKRAKAAAK